MREDLEGAALPCRGDSGLLVSLLDKFTHSSSLQHACMCLFESVLCSVRVCAYGAVQPALCVCTSLAGREDRDWARAVKRLSRV